MPSAWRKDPSPIEIGTQEPALADIREMLCTALEMPNALLTGNEALADLRAWDSLAVLNLMAAIDARFGITLSPERIVACETIRDLAMLVTGRR